MNLETLIATTIDGHLKNGGSSMSLIDGHSPKDGFMVSTLGNEWRVKSPVRPIKLEWYLSQIADLASLRRCNAIHTAYLGTWFDAGSELPNVIDISINVPTLGEAMDLAKRNKQIAIYDVVKGESVYL